MNLNELEILEDDFDLFVVLDNKEKIEFLFDAMNDGIEASVTKQTSKLSESISLNKSKIRVEDFIIEGTRLCLTLTNNQVHLNSDSLKAIRMFVNKMINDGLLLWPIKTEKTVFDMYKYFKAYKIIARGTPISSN